MMNGIVGVKTGRWDGLSKDNLQDLGGGEMLDNW